MAVKVILGVLIINHLFTINVHALLHLDPDSDKYPFDRQIYEDALDPELCQRQLTYLMMNNTILLARFLDAGIRIPRGILMGNTIDLGNYHQCLAIKEPVDDDTEIAGKYCRIRVPVNQDFHLPVALNSRPLWKFDPSEWNIDKETLRQLEDVDRQKIALKSGLAGTELDLRVAPDSPLTSVNFQLAVCIPRVCTSEQAINGLLFNLSNVGFQFSEVSCRLPGDRPWVAADYVATVVFSIIGLLTIVSTSYDLWQSVYLKKDAKAISAAYTCFSVRTNARRLVSFGAGAGALPCLDGVRALAMLWVILGHSFFTVPDPANPLEALHWTTSLRAGWITVAPLSVDTFFFLSGLLLVYTTVGKLGPMKLLKNIHVFYLHRLLRMFPVLAAVILYEASFYFRLSDGPLWDTVAIQTLKCREFWWSTLLHVQNFVNPREACIGVTWYLAIDVQLHVLSPLVLVWVLRSARAAWAALTAALLAVFTAATVFVFYRDFPSGVVSPNRQADIQDFYIYYYVNILTRASPFIIGMVYGYLLHLWKNRHLSVSKMFTSCLLACSLTVMLAVMYCSQRATRLDWRSQLGDNLFNSLLRPLWALALGWLIFACVHGRAEPLNWLLSLRVWKLPARISYAMYLTHYSLMVAYYSSALAPVYFSVPSVLFNFLAFMMATLIVSFFVTLLIDSPFSTIFKLLLGGTKKSHTPTSRVANESGRPRGNGIDNSGFEADRKLRVQPSNKFKKCQC